MTEIVKIAKVRPVVFPPYSTNKVIIQPSDDNLVVIKLNEQIKIQKCKQNVGSTQATRTSKTHKLDTRSKNIKDTKKQNRLDLK